MRSFVLSKKGGLLSVFVSMLLSLPLHAEKMVFTSNIPELYAQENGYSLAKIATFVKRLKRDEATVFVHGGDSLSPNPLSVYDHGAHMIAVMNAMSVDAMAMNRRDFNFGIDQVTLLSAQSRFPMVLSNLLDKRTQQAVAGVQPYLIMPVGDTHVGILSTVSDSINQTYLFNKATVNEQADYINSMADMMEQRGASHTVLITEQSYIDQVPVAALDSMDVILITQDGKDEVVSESPLVVYSGGVDDEVVVVDFTKTKVSAEIIHTNTERPSQAIEGVIARYTSQLDVVLDQTITTLETPMDSYRETLRSAESTWANIVLDAVRDYTRADFAVLGGGSMRGDRAYDAGYVISRRDIQKELPFGGSICVVEVTPKQLKDTLEHGVSMVEKLEGRFLQVSGLRYRYDPERPVGQRVIALTDAQGQSLVSRNYTLAISDYMLRGGDGYQFAKRKVVSEGAGHQRLLWNIVSDYLSGFDSISPRLDGRIMVEN